MNILEWNLFRRVVEMDVLHLRRSNIFRSPHFEVELEFVPFQGAGCSVWETKAKMGKFSAHENVITWFNYAIHNSSAVFTSLLRHFAIPHHLQESCMKFSNSSNYKIIIITKFSCFETIFAFGIYWLLSIDYKKLPRAPECGVIIHFWNDFFFVGKTFCSSDTLTSNQLCVLCFMCNSGDSVENTKTLPLVVVCRRETKKNPLWGLKRAQN